MKFSEIISISGKSGLFRLVNSRPDGIIVQGLEDGKSTFISSRVHNVITLENIAIYREHEETTPLRDVLVSMKDKATDVAIPEPGSDEKTLRAYMEQILPDYDRQRVHLSDLKKLVRWYHILMQKDILPQPEEELKANDEAMRDQEAESTEKATKPKKTKAKAVGTDDEAGGEPVVEEKPKPKRKPAAKKKAE